MTRCKECHFCPPDICRQADQIRQETMNGESKVTLGGYLRRFLNDEVVQQCEQPELLAKALTEASKRVWNPVE